jgi:hypothetical protein
MKKVAIILVMSIVCLFASVSFAGLFDRDNPPSTWKNVDVVYEKNDGYIYSVCTELSKDEESCAHWMKFGEFLETYHRLNEENTGDGKHTRTTWKKLSQEEWVMKTETIDEMKKESSHMKVLIRHIKFSDNTYGVKISRIIIDDRLEMGTSFIVDFLHKIGDNIE